MNPRIANALGAVLLVLAVVAAAVGVLYLVTDAKSLPSFLPGATHHGKYKETHKAIAAFVVAVVLLVAAGGGVVLGRRSRPVA